MVDVTLPRLAVFGCTNCTHLATWSFRSATTDLAGRFYDPREEYEVRWTDN